MSRFSAELSLKCKENCCSMIFVDKNEKENGVKRKNKFVNETKRKKWQKLKWN